MTDRTDGPSSAVRIRVYKRDRFTCTYCGVSGQDAELEVDHIIPVAKGGSHHISNLTTCCRTCNQSKGAGDAPKQGTRASIQPVQAAPRHMLVGKFIHTYNEGSIRYQGLIKDCDGQMCLVQLFSWIMGEPTNIVAMPVSEIYSETVKIFADRESWLHNAEMDERRKRGRQ